MAKEKCVGNRDTHVVSEERWIDLIYEANSLWSIAAPFLPGTNPAKHERAYLNELQFVLDKRFQARGKDTRAHFEGYIEG